MRAYRLTCTELAVLHAARARALGKLGRVQEALAAVGHADDAFANRQPTDDPRWMAHYDSAQHYGDTGHALFDLAQTARYQAHGRQERWTRLAKKAGQSGSIQRGQRRASAVIIDVARPAR